MYNMERYCTRPYCIENPYFMKTRILRFSIQYGLVQYLSILYITLYKISNKNRHLTFSGLFCLLADDKN
jgi:hypothetical protein